MKYVDLPLLTLCVAFIAFPIFYITPRNINFLCQGKRYIHDNRSVLILLDILFHWSPLAFVILNKSISKQTTDYTKIMVTILGILLYINLFNAFELYNFKGKDIGMMFFVLAILVRFMLK
jgi:hypothetical protein